MRYPVCIRLNRGTTIDLASPDIGTLACPKDTRKGGNAMPDLSAQLEPHDAYVDLQVVGHSVWWREGDCIKWSGRMPRAEVDQVLRHLNLSYYPITFWRAPVYHWERLVEAAIGAPLGDDAEQD